MFNIPFFGRKKLLLAFEYGLIVADVAKEQNVEVTPELIKRAEAIIESEFRKYGPTYLAVNIVPLILTIFETDLSK
jgi:hypothetical protein